MKTTFEWFKQTEKEIINVLNIWLKKQMSETPKHLNGVLVDYFSIDRVFDKIEEIFRTNSQDELHEAMIDQGKRSKQQFDGIVKLINHYGDKKNE